MARNHCDAMNLRHPSMLLKTSALGGVGDQPHALAALPRGKRPCTHGTGSWMCPKGRSGQVRKIPPPLGFDPRTVQPVASWYTDYAMLDPAFQC
jgi:hypothetical protein